jgi:redox-sensitive bicupin YhaK (pirin superfamily)
MQKLRQIERLIEPQFVIEGAGVLLRRSFGPRRSNEFDPFLLFDHFAFNDPNEGPIRGFPTHPHRGIETVTYMLEGSVRHRDSLANMGTIGAGDVQWMTSGRGILHEEMPQRSASGNIYGFQLWVNLPARLKMSAPRYQEVNDKTIPVMKQDGIKIRLVAGTIENVTDYVTGNITGPVTGIAAAPLYMDVQLAPGMEWTLPTPEGHTVIAYTFEGAGVFSGETVTSVRMIQYEDGDHIRVKAENSPVRFMLMAGAPFKEPIVPYGPFVMNTEQEIYQALADLKAGTFVT